jgi:hypothetical protein
VRAVDDLLGILPTRLLPSVAPGSSRPRERNGLAPRTVLILCVWVDYRYELRGGDELVATGHLSREQPLQVGDRLEVSGQPAIVRTIEPLLGEAELPLVLQLLPGGS